MKIITLENGKQVAVNMSSPKFVDEISGSIGIGKVVKGTSIASGIYSTKITINSLPSIAGRISLNLNSDLNYCDVHLGIREVKRLYITKVPVVSGIVNITLNNIVNDIYLGDITNLTTKTLVAAFLATQNYVGYVATYREGDEYITFTASDVGVKLESSFANNNTGLICKFLDVVNGENIDTVETIVAKLAQTYFYEYENSIVGNSVIFRRKGAGNVLAPTITVPEGLFYTIENLAENVVNINSLSQLDFSDENTLYEIREEFDLLGQTIKIPTNSTVYLNGGSLKNGKVFSDNISTKIINPPAYNGDFDNRIYFGKFFNQDGKEYTYKWDIINRTVPFSVISASINFWTFAKDTRANYFSLKETMDRSIKCGFNDIEVWLSFSKSYMTNNLFWDMMPSIDSFIEVCKKWNYPVKYLRSGISVDLVTNTIARDDWKEKFKDYVTKLVEQIPTIEYVFTNNEDGRTICSLGSIWISAIIEIHNWIKTKKLKHAISTNITNFYDPAILALDTVFTKNIYLSTTGLNYSYDSNQSIGSISRSRVEREILGKFSPYFNTQDIYISETGCGVLMNNGAHVDLYHSDPFKVHDNTYLQLKSYIEVWKYAFSGIKQRLKLVMWWALTDADEKDCDIMYNGFINY